MKRVLEAIFASFIFHFLLLLGVVLLAPRFENKPPEVIEISLAPPPKTEQRNATKKEQQVVRQALVPDRMKAPEDETLARFLSEQKQRVKQETQAADNGMTENRSNQSSQKSPQKQEQKPQQKQQAQKEQTQEKDKDGYRTVDISKELNEMNRLNEGRSMVGESLPTDVKVGSFTALNTDRYLFYTFYARIEELVRFRWESRVQQAIDSFDRMTAVNAGGKNWNTQVEFLLDRKGFLQKAIIMKESGIKSFDAAAVNAFKEARIFPNPPQEMVQDDGYIHLKFTFTVNYRPPVLVDRN
ncbi:TonB family protein [Bdellovibrio svalbardensis]|uniref:Energy transducer TonB n=1 Tax=Bdellovibrio svalbardensis TaxID=2972972 RepID=A0ABT6DLM6_9BACT|nr:TonB family protein [Bdellovibrio svalbardensis]MDG0816814.1 energy transducer TonB [Bdellovibrio svalbardensis]